MNKKLFNKEMNKKKRAKGTVVILNDSERSTYLKIEKESRDNMSMMPKEYNCHGSF
jgi:hypothetical protein